MPGIDHLQTPPDPAFWKNVLFFEAFDSLLAQMATASGLDTAWNEMCEATSVRNVATAIASRRGNGTDVRRNLVMASRFCEHKRGGAIEAVAEVALGRQALQVHRTPGGALRRRPVALLLFELDPKHLLAIDLWHRWHSCRTSFYRLERPLASGLDLVNQPWETAITAALASLKGSLTAGTDGFEVHRVFQGPEDDVLLAFQEWPKQRAVRMDRGVVVSGHVPEWTLLHLHRQGHRLDVTDSRIDRGAILANAILRQLVDAAPAFELLQEPLNDRKLSEFLALLTSEENNVLPLVEIVAEETWNPRRTMITLTGTPSRSVESSVASLRSIGAFALDWRTVRSAKVAFQTDYKITLFFPTSGDPAALTYSDVDRDKRVTARFAEVLKKVLHVEVAPKARRGTSRPVRHMAPAPPKHSQKWWEQVLATRHDGPPDWLCTALRELEKLGLVKTSRSRVLQCGSPYLNRAAVGVDSIDCDGDVEFPWEDDDPEDPTAREDQGVVRCSRGDHKWRPVRYRVPVDERVHVMHQHPAIWDRLLEELVHFGEVQEEPGRPGVATVRLPEVRVAMVYVPLVSDSADLDPASFGRTPAAWVYPPGSPVPQVGPAAIPLADVLAAPTALATCWGIELVRHRRPSPLNRAPMLLHESQPPPTPTSRLRIIELTSKGVFIDGHRVAGRAHSANRLLELLHHAAIVDEADGRLRQPYTPEGLQKLRDDDGEVVNNTVFHGWVSRTRSKIEKAIPTEPGLGALVIVTKGQKYRLGDGFLCADRRGDAPEGD